MIFQLVKRCKAHRGMNLKTLKKYKKANISIMVVVFSVSFLAFCAFGIDMAYVTLNRAKLQRATETTALASVGEYKNSGIDKSEIFFNLFKSKFDIMKNAKLDEVVYKNEDKGIKKIKIRTSLISPTFFLRFAGVGKINIKANSYAQTYELIIEDKKSSDTIELNDLVTNKNGYDIKIETENLPEGYFIFAGMKNKDNVLMWADIGCKTDAQKTSIQKGLNNYTLIKSNEALYDIGKDCEEQTNTNVLTHLRLYSNSQNATDYSFKITVLNNVKLITKNDF